MPHHNQCVTYHVDAECNDHICVETCFYKNWLRNYRLMHGKVNTNKQTNKMTGRRGGANSSPTQGWGAENDSVKLKRGHNTF